ncbi:MAG: hypothetical protein M9892_04490 [Bacteroidetes bacterium]|nr:hypothetical protein [Bacteroidota bacterium]
MKTYSLSHRSVAQFKAIFTYREDGLLVSAVYPSDAPADILMGFIRCSKYKEQELLQMNDQQGLKVQIQNADLSFDNFWQLYAYKVGAKKKSEELWKKLSEDDRADAIKGIRKYDNYLRRTGIAKVYPERYIKYRRWEDEY